MTPQDAPERPGDAALADGHDVVELLAAVRDCVEEDPDPMGWLPRLAGRGFVVVARARLDEVIGDAEQRAVEAERVAGNLRDALAGMTADRDEMRDAVETAEQRERIRIVALLRSAGMGNAADTVELS